MVSGQVPVLQQVSAVPHRPFYHQSQNSRRKAAAEQRHRLDGDQSFVLSIARMKMGRRMIIVIHRYDDSEKAADLRHSLDLFRLRNGVLGVVRFPGSPNA